MRETHSESDEITKTSDSSTSFSTAFFLPEPRGRRSVLFCLRAPVFVSGVRFSFLLRASEVSDAAEEERETADANFVPGVREGPAGAAARCALQPPPALGALVPAATRAAAWEDTVPPVLMALRAASCLLPAGPSCPSFLASPGPDFRTTPLMRVTMSFSGSRSGMPDHDARRALARTLASLSECRRRETVSPPREKARSASVEVAVYNDVSVAANIVHFMTNLVW